MGSGLSKVVDVPEAVKCLSSLRIYPKVIDINSIRALVRKAQALSAQSKVEEDWRVTAMLTETRPSKLR